MTTPARPRRGFDPEAEQEVDFAHYLKLLAGRWWLLGAGLVLGAVIGFFVSLGGNQVYAATASLSLGQPYTPDGENPVITPAANPSSVGQIINSQSVINAVAKLCHTKPDTFEQGISTQAAAASKSSKGGKPAATPNPLVNVSVQSNKGKVAACAANSLAAKVVRALGKYPAAQIKNLQGHLVSHNKDIQEIRAAFSNPSLSETDKLVLQTRLHAAQIANTATSQQLLLAKTIESPSVRVPGVSNKITARSRRNTVAISALIGLILAAIATLLWDPLAKRLTPRTGNGD